MDRTKLKSILIAEDEPDLGLLLMYYLQRQDFRTLTAADGRSALKMAFDLKPDLILLDLMLPHIHGFEICRLVKQSPMTRHIPVVIYSALSSLENKEKGIRLGATEYFSKQERISDVLKKIRTILNSQSSK
jgi:DNA-binding response OmpR family regulator